MNSNHEAVPFGGFEVYGTTLSTTPNQPGSTNVIEHGVSRIDGLYSSSFGGLRIDSQVGNTSFPNPKPSKRKSSYNRQNKEKKRFIWSSEAHQCFLEALNRLPEDSLYPRNILKEMLKTYPEITREIVASHLQKYRLSLKANEKKNERNSANSSSQSVSTKVTKQKNNVHSNSTYPNYGAEIVLNSSTDPNPNPNPNSQNYFFSNCPISQIQSFSINSFNNPSNIIPNSQFLQKETISHFEKLHLSANPKTVYDQSSTLDVHHENDLSIHLEPIIHSKVNNFERENNYPVEVKLGHSSNEANNSHIPTPTNHQLDGYGRNVFNHIMDYNSFYGDLDYGNEYYSLFDIQNFNNEYDLSLTLEDSFNNYECSLPFNHESQVNYSQQGSRSKLENNSILPQNFGSHNIH